MAENVKLAENVILVDVAYFNDVVKDLKRYFELQLGRPLQNIYVEEWASYLALDSGVRDKDNNIEVLFVHDSHIALNSADVKRLMLVPFIDDYGAKLMEVLDEYLRNADTENSKGLFLFNMDEPAHPLGCKWDLLGYSMMRALGIKAEELE